MTKVVPAICVGTRRVCYTGVSEGTRAGAAPVNRPLAGAQGGIEMATCHAMPDRVRYPAGPG